jgi:hypothetical protein
MTKPAPSILDSLTAKLAAAPVETQREVLRFVEAIETKQALQDARFADSFEPFFGLTSGSYVFAGDPVDLQRKVRDVPKP